MTVHQEIAFEDSIEKHLVGDGWSRLEPGGYDRALGLFPDTFLAFLEASQPAAWEQLVLRLGGDGQARAKVVQHVAAALSQRGTISVLRGTLKLNGVAFRTCFFKPANSLSTDLLARYAANDLAVVRQLHHSESDTARSLDMVLVVNGLPTATVELKNPLTGQNVEHAMSQYRTDRNPSDLIFRERTFVHFAVDPHRVYMTTKLARAETRFLPFNQGSGGAGEPGGDGNPANSAGHATSYLWEQVWQRDAWLQIIESFVHQSGTGPDSRILFPRFHQWHAVRQILAATLRDGVGHDRLIQHSAGSGKSNTIAWTAHLLSRLHDENDRPVFDKVVIITDRIVLDRQLQETVAGLDHTPGTIQRIDKDSTQLKSALETNAARIIITTLQKFPVIAQEAADVVGRNFVVLVDEAHSSTSGEGMTQLKGVLGGPEQKKAAQGAGNSTPTQDVTTSYDEDDDDAGIDLATDVIEASALTRQAKQSLTFVAFTATPKPKTLNLFGEETTADNGAPTRKPFHLYSMRQAIEEGFILDVLANYTTYQTYYRVATTGPDDPDVDLAEARAEIAKHVSLHPSHVSSKARMIVDHFRRATAGKINGDAKAMIVTRSRLHAVRYKEAIDAYLVEKGYDQGPRAVRSLVAFSGTVTDEAKVLYTERGMNGFSESELPRKFAAEGVQLLVVADKYQTGFDQPLLHTMYVDRKLAGVRAVQTLSRLNRVHPGKTDTFVLDFANTAQEIQDAFAKFFEQASAYEADPNDLSTFEHTLMSANVLDVREMEAAAQALLSGVTTRQFAVYANLSTAVGRFDALDADQQRAFRDTLKAYVRAYAFLAQIMTWTDRDLERLYLYGKALLTVLPHDQDDPMPLVSDQVQLTHLRTALVAAEENASLVAGDDEPGVVLPGGGTGGQDPLVDKLSVLVARMNDAFGVGTTEADKIWWEQQRASVKADSDLRIIALHNSRDDFELMLRDRVPHHVAARHGENTKMFDLFFNKPGFSDAVLTYLGDLYDEFRTVEVMGGDQESTG